MSNIVIIGFATEGATDVRFLESIIRRTFEEVALNVIVQLKFILFKILNLLVKVL
jgi:hypothetical protein